MTDIHLSAGYDRVRKLIARAIKATDNKRFAEEIDGGGHLAIAEIDSALLQAADLVLDEAATYATFEELAEFVTEPWGENEGLFRQIVDAMLLLEAPKTKIVLVAGGVIMTLADDLNAAIDENDRTAGQEQSWTKVDADTAKRFKPKHGSTLVAISVPDREWKANEGGLASEVGDVVGHFFCSDERSVIKVAGPVYVTP